MANRILSVFCLIAFLAPLARAADVVLVRAGKPVATIVISTKALPAERRGAEELQSHIEKMSGAQLQIVTDDQPMPASAILVGRSRHMDALHVQIDPSLGEEGFVIRTVGPHLVVAGPGKRGTMYGCTTLLEKLGVRWFTPTVTRTPHQTTLSVPSMDETQTPAFEYRETYFAEAMDKDWAARLKTNGESARLDDSTGGKVRYDHFVHTFDALIPRSLYATHPEYFPLIKGKRADGYVQRCLSNPQVLKLATDTVRQWMSHSDATIFSVSQNDTYNFCECEKCKGIEARYGGQHSGLYLWFVNQIAEQMEKEFPDKLIDTLAYQFTEAPPAGIVPRKNVRVRLCPIAACDAHPFENCSYQPTRDFLDHLRGWAKITDTLYIWHYNTNFAGFVLPFPDFDEFPADIRLYQRSGVKGIFFEGDGGSAGASDAELRSYVMARLLWNPKQDSDALVTEWMQGVYGKAAEPMHKWFDLLQEKVRDPKQHLRCFTRPPGYYMTPEVIEAGDRLFAEAEKLAASDATAADYVAKSRLGLRFAKLYQHPTEGPELQSFLADLHRRHITQLREGQPLEKWEQEYRKRAAASR